MLGVIGNQLLQLFRYEDVLKVLYDVWPPYSLPTGQLGEWRMLQVLLNPALKHPEGNKNHAHLLFIDFSSAVNCIQPHVFAHRLLSHFNIDFSEVCWLNEFFMNRSQRVNGALSSELSSSTGSPQGCVLFYSFYTQMSPKAICIKICP